MFQRDDFASFLSAYFPDEAINSDAIEISKEIKTTLPLGLSHVSHVNNLAGLFRNDITWI